MSTSSEPPSSPPSPSPAPQSQLSLDQAKCLCKLTDITNQLLHEDPKIRFQCLAYSESRHASPLRCKNRFDEPPKPRILAKASTLIERTSPPISSDEYVGNIIKILFCSKHIYSGAFPKYRDILQQHWTQDGGPEEVQLLDTIRRVCILPTANSIPENDIMRPSSIPFNIPSRPRLNTDGLGSDPQLSTSAIRPDPRTVATTPSRPGQSLALEESPLEQENFASPSLILQHARSTSNPTQPEDEIGSAENRNSRGVPEVTKDIAQFPSLSDHFQVPHSEFTFRPPGLSSNIFPPRRQLKDEPLQTELVRPTRFASEPIQPSAETLDQPQEFAEASPDLASTSPLGQEVKSAMHAGNSLSKDVGTSVDVTTLFGTQSSRPPTHQFQPIPTRQETRDDLHLPAVRLVPNPAPSPAPKPSTPAKSTPKNKNIPKKSNQYGIVDFGILHLIRAPMPDPRKFVYVLKAPGYFAANGMTTLVKIGVADNVRERISQLERECGLEGLEIVTDFEDEPTIYHKKIEDLAHEELRNFQRDFACGGTKCPTKAHKEWFEVPEEVALQVVQRWRRFIKAEPYDELGILRDRWSSVIRRLVWQPKDEAYDDHERRDKRWQDWLDKVIVSKEAVTAT